MTEGAVQWALCHQHKMHHLVITTTASNCLAIPKSCKTKTDGWTISGEGGLPASAAQYLVIIPFLPFSSVQEKG